MSKTNSLYMEQDQQLWHQIYLIGKDCDSYEEYIERTKDLIKDLSMGDLTDHEQELEFYWIELCNHWSSKCQ